jgi:hypothetical protein
MTTKFPGLEEALKKHCLDSAGNIYTIGANDVMAYIEGDLALENPELAARVSELDETSLALEIADCIGNIGIVEFVEGAIRDAIRKELDYAEKNPLRSRNNVGDGLCKHSLAPLP